MFGAPDCIGGAQITLPPKVEQGSGEQSPTGEPEIFTVVTYTISDFWVLERTSPFGLVGQDYLVWKQMSKNHYIQLDRQETTYPNGPSSLEIRWSPISDINPYRDHMDDLFNISSPVKKPCTDWLGWHVAWFWEENKAIDPGNTTDAESTTFTIGVNVAIPDKGSQPPSDTTSDKAPIAVVDKIVTDKSQDTTYTPNPVNIVTLPGIQYAGSDTEVTIDDEFALVPRYDSVISTVKRDGWYYAKRTLREGQIITGSDLAALGLQYTEYGTVTAGPEKKYIVTGITLATGASYYNLPSGTLVGHNRLWLPVKEYTISIRPSQEVQ